MSEEPYGGAYGYEGRGRREEGISEEEKEMILRRFLTLEARQRLKNVSLVRPEVARAIEDYVVNMALSGRLNRRLGEDDIKELLSRLSRRTEYRLRGIW